MLHFKSWDTSIGTWRIGFGGISSALAVAGATSFGAGVEVVRLGSDEETIGGEAVSLNVSAWGAGTGWAYFVSSVCKGASIDAIFVLSTEA